MALNIKNPATIKLVRELSKVTGETMTAGITASVRERLDRVRGENGAELAKRLVEIGKDCSAHLRGPSRYLDHGKLLYNRKGLPR